ncbi:MAG TPA: SulP family inorganic anion transporter [Sphingomonadales bacterium]|nr:SulP family inorganic anion transporter [Sphingomonadales bacterium]
MSGFLPRLSFRNFRGDLFGGLTAAVVALPLALAFGIASGLGPIAGLYGAIAVGFFAALFGGTPAQVSGPTGPMTVVMAAVVATHAGNLPEAFGIVILGGFLQIVFGAARLGRYITYTPYSVVSGFMTGIGFIIILLQIFPFIGLTSPEGGPLGSLRVLGALAGSALNLQALSLAAGSLLIVIFWPTGFRKYVPSPLAALVIGTLAALAFLPEAPIIGSVPRGLPLPHLPIFSSGTLATVVQGAFVLALLGSIDSLLTSLVADSITRTRHDSNRELMGQGLGNIAAGLIGGLPGAGATMRTVVNVRAGGRTGLSGAIHALLLLGLALGLGPLAEKVPYAVLAGILVKVGWDIIDWGYLKRLPRVPREKAAVMLTTVALTVCVDLITAVAVGIILAFFVNAKKLEVEQLKGLKHTAGEDEAGHLSEEEKAAMKKAAGQVVLTLLHGTFSFASARELAHRVGQRISGCRIVIYDMADVGYIDPSAAMALDEVFAAAQDNRQEVFVSGLKGEAEKTLRAFGVLGRVPRENLFAARMAAIAEALNRLPRTEKQGE